MRSQAELGNEMKGVRRCLGILGRMTVRKTDPRLRRRYFWNFLLLGLPFAAAFIAGVAAHLQGRIDWFIAFFVVGMVIVLIGVLRQERLFRRYHCGDCGAALEYKRREPGERIEYYCPHCDTIWDSGFSESSGD